MIRRESEFTGTNFKFHADFAREELKQTAQTIGRALLRSTSDIKKLVVPLSPLQEAVLTKEEILDAANDTEALYLLLGKIEFVGEEPPWKVLYKENADGALTITGKIYENVIMPVVSVQYKEDIFDRISQATLKSELDNRQREIRDKAITEFLKGASTKRIEDAKRDRENADYEYTQARTRLIQRAAERENAIAKELGAIEFANTGNVNTKEILDELCSSKYLKDVRYSKETDTLTFETPMISITDIGGSVHPIGEMRVDVNMRTSDMRIFNNCNKIDTAQYTSIPHPHVGTDGRPCLGSIGGILPELVAQRDLLGMWQIICSYLTSYNPADVWGKRLRYWPAYDENGEKVAKPTVNANCGCVTCGNDLEDDAVVAVECGVCGELMCEDCAHWSESRDMNLCEDHGVWCETCQDWHIRDEVTMYTCATCDNSVCGSEARYSDMTEQNYCCEDCLIAAEEEANE